MSHPTHWASPASTELTSVAFLLGLGYFFQHPRCRLRKAPLFFIFTFNFSRQLSRSRDCRFRRFSHNPTHYARRALDVCLRSLFLYRVSKRPCLRTRVRPNEAAKPERPCSWTHWVATATYIDAGRALFFYDQLPILQPYKAPTTSIGIIHPDQGLTIEFSGAAIHKLHDEYAKGQSTTSSQRNSLSAQRIRLTRRSLGIPCRRTRNAHLSPALLHIIVGYLLYNHRPFLTAWVLDVFRVDHLFFRLHFRRSIS